MGKKTTAIATTPKESLEPALTPEEATDYIKWHPVTIRLACREGRIRAVKVGPRWLIPTAELLRIQREGIPSK